MTIIRNLLPGQYQIGDLVFGRGTTVPVETFDPKPYDINNQDVQLGMNDEMLFGKDQLKPTTIELTFHVRYNWLLPKYVGLIPNFWAEMPTVADFVREWKADEVRLFAGEVKPLYLCDRSGIHKVIYGRPGQFTPADNSDYTESVQCLGEFRRLDTFAYGVTENAVPMDLAGTPPTVTLTPGGDAPAWYRLLLRGPLTHPVFQLSASYQRGPQTIDFDYDLADGEVVEISSYPWQRRVVNSATPPLNLASKLVGATPYLDRLRIGDNTPVDITLSSGTGITANTEVLVLWHDAYQVAR